MASDFLHIYLPLVVIDSNGFDYDIDYDGSISDGETDAFDGAFEVVGFPSLYEAVIDTETSEIVIGSINIGGGLLIERRLFIGDDFIRYIDVITNATGSDLSYTHTVENNFGADSYTTVVAQGGDADTLTYFVVDDTLDDLGTGNTVVGIVLGNETGTGASSVYSVDADEISFAFDLDLAPGETAAVMYFGIQANTQAEATATAEVLANLGGGALDNIHDDILSEIVNFDLSEQLPSGPLDLSLTNGDDEQIADSGDDTIEAGKGNDTVLGLEGDDKIVGSQGADVLLGGPGDDILIGDFDTSPVTTANQTTLTNGLPLAVSLTLPDASNETEINAFGGLITRTAVTNDNFNVAFVIDVSASTSGSFEGNSIPDANGDGYADQLIDAAIIGFESLLESLIDAGVPDANVAVIPFDDSAYTLINAPANQDTDGDGVLDIVEALRSLRDGGNTDYEAALQETINFFSSAPEGNNYVYFLSDGYHNGSPYVDEAGFLIDDAGINATITAVGLGSGSSEGDLDFVDDTLDNDSVQIVLDPASLDANLQASNVDTTEIDHLEVYVNGSLFTTILPSELVATPFGLSYSVDLTGLSATAADSVEVVVVSADAANTTVSTSQVIEVVGNGGDDVLTGDSGDDVIYGGSGADLIDGGADNDMIHGDGGQDIITGASGNDTIDGGFGNDKLIGDIGADSLLGGDGDDTHYGGLGNDWLEGDDGSDFIYGNQGSDTIIGGVTSDWLVGGSGKDSLYGGNGFDTIEGGTDDDIIFGDDGNDEIIGDGGNDQMFGQVGNDTVDGAIGDDEMYLGGGDDLGLGGEGFDYIFGGNGSDTLRGGSNADTLDGGAGTDFIEGHVGQDSLIGDAGDDTLRGGNSNDTLDGGEGDDSLEGGQGSDVAYGGNGNDVIRGENGYDTLDGGFGFDTIFSGSGNDLASGGANADLIFGGVGEDTLIGGAGTDTLTGGADADVFVLDLGDGNDTITDFNVAEDVIDISGQGFSSFNQVMAFATQQGSDVYFNFLNGDSILVENISTGDFSADDFII